MPLEVRKTYDPEILKSSDYNADNNHLLTYIKQNKDRIVGDNAESTGVTPHDHEGTYGKVLGTDALEDSAVTTAKINDGDVTTDKLDADAVDNTKLADGAVQTENIVDSNVTTVKIADLNITEGKIGAGAVTAGKIGTGAVTEDKIGSLAVSVGKIATAAVNESKIATGAVTEGKIGTGAVTEGKIGTGAVTGSKLGTGAVTESKLGTSSVSTTKIIDNTVTYDKCGHTLRRRILSERLTHVELIYVSSDTIYVGFPWTEPGGTAWSGTTALDVSKNVASSGHVKDGVTANQASTWYYLYMSNAYTVADPVASEFIFTQSPDGESGYTLVGAVYNNASQNIEPFDYVGNMVMWRDPIKVLNTGTASTYTDIDCSVACPEIPLAAGTIIKLAGIVTGTADSSAGTKVLCCVTKNGVTPVDDAAQYFAKINSYVLNANTISISGSRDIQTDNSRKIEYKVDDVNASNVAATIYVAGYYVR